MRQNRPVVALESTLITHGFPRPDNYRIAQAIEETVREQGAVPATIAILEGQLFVGLSREQLARLSEADAVRKCSVRNLPTVLAQKNHGATTVAATMIIAHQAGIQVFATGGIGGVHRNLTPGQVNGHHGAQREALINSWDVSADLTELGRTPITVVCAGMKAFLDLPATLEYLETQAVPVVGYGVSELPAFYSCNSGLSLDECVDTPQAVADIVHIRDSLGLNNAILVTVPVPVKDEWPAGQAGPIIEQALVEAFTQQISGKAVTPFLLSRIAELSGGLSKQANESLLINNAKIGAQIAKAYCAVPES